MHHCSDGCLAPFTVSSGAAWEGGPLHIAGACNGTQNAAHMAVGPAKPMFASPVSVVEGGAADGTGTITS